jgi:hypothetical protein
MEQAESVQSIVMMSKKTFGIRALLYGRQFIHPD